jgi:hypothetical protein
MLSYSRLTWQESLGKVPLPPLTRATGFLAGSAPEDEVAVGEEVVPVLPVEFNSSPRGVIALAARTGDSPARRHAAPSFPAADMP